MAGIADANKRDLFRAPGKTRALRSSPGRQRGFTLAELTISTLIASSLITGIAIFLKEQQDDRERTLRASWMAQYVNGIAAYMANQGTSAPAALNQAGTDWLKPIECGGNQPNNLFFLSCNIPTNFNGDYGLAPPQVSFDWTEPRAPEADITFGPILNAGGQPNPPAAAAFAEEINRRLRVDGYEHAGAFIVNPATAGGAAIAAELQNANLRAFVDASIENTVFVRLDGNSIMRGTLINENDSWAMIARDAAGNEVDLPTNPRSSINTNDMFVRAAGQDGVWASETHELAEEAYRIAIRAPIFVTNVRSGQSITKPTCPAPLVEQISAVPAGFVGGPVANDPRFVAGVRTRVIENAATYDVFMDVLYDGQANFVQVGEDVEGGTGVDPEMGLINVSIKCADA